MKYGSFEGANLSNADLRQSTIRAVFDQANLEGAIFNDADLDNSNFYHANLSNAVLSNANLSGVDMRFAILNGANLYSSNLSFANMLGADLSNSNLSLAILDGASFNGADLSNANLSYAHLSNIYMDEAHVYSDLFYEANLFGAVLTHEHLINLQRLQLEKVPIWSEQDFEETMSELNWVCSGTSFLARTDNIPELLFTDQPLPTMRQVYTDCDYTSAVYVAMYDIEGYERFQNFFIYASIYDIPVGAKTLNWRNHLVAEARFLGIIEDKSDEYLAFEIEEFHYDINGNLVFKCISLIVGGSKYEETMTMGKKIQDYYFYWP